MSDDDPWFLSAIAADTPRFAKAVREHWRVKNNLHWRLDVIFDQDANSIRKGSSKRIRAIMTAQ